MESENQTKKKGRAGIDGEAVLQQAEENMKHGSAEFRRLTKELDAIDIHRDFVKVSIVKAKMRALVQKEYARLWKLEMEKRNSLQSIGEQLLKKSREEYDHWQELLAGMSFVMDMLDFTVADINELLSRNGIAVKMDDFKEIHAARVLAQNLMISEVKEEGNWKGKMWMDESDRLWEHLKARCTTFRRKVDRVLDKLEQAGGGKKES